MPTEHDARSHVRLASKRAGDDVTFSRYVRAVKTGKVSSPRLPGLELDAVRAGRSFFWRKGVKDPIDNQLLVSGHNNVKIGRDVRQGRFRGYMIYTLSLEERATCPRSCHHWQNCYGNSMPYAKRLNHRAPAFLHMLERNLEGLLSIRRRAPRTSGVLVRLHALGDFYSEDYVDFWANMLAKHERLAIFGYTAWAPHTPIGAEVDKLIDLFPGRAMMRFSNGGLATRSTVPIMRVEDCPPGAFVCPEQTGQFEACGKCGACWSTLKNVAFLAH